MKKGLLLIMVLCGFGCTETKVSVVCAGKDSGTVDCTLAEVSGNGKAKTCWDTMFKCDNGTKPTMAACDEVEKAKPTMHAIKIKDFKGADKCDKLTPNSLAVENIKVTKE